MNKKELLKDPLFILEKFHPLALLVACGILILIIEKTCADVTLLEKTMFVILGGPLYVIDISFESWRIATLTTKEKTNKIRP